MSAKPERREIPLKAGPAVRMAYAPAWWLRWRLRLVSSAVMRLEQQLAGEFALLETEPLLQELETLVAEREKLLERLTGR